MESRGQRLANLAIVLRCRGKAQSKRRGKDRRCVNHGAKKKFNPHAHPGESFALAGILKGKALLPKSDCHVDLISELWGDLSGTIEWS